jgi:hypothetical protein
MLRQQRFALVQPAAGAEVERRSLADYDTALGVGWIRRTGGTVTGTKTAARNVTAEIAYLTRVPSNLFDIV